uniref:Putative secreted peptide n=1 Tax=Anopheles braziliensis TaxID=58242 RepID=A0A2M3ZXE8_9DIPT
MMLLLAGLMLPLVDPVAAGNRCKTSLTSTTGQALAKQPLACVTSSTGLLDQPVARVNYLCAFLFYDL